MEAKRWSGWRKKSKRGVSPIIATILLVAITVVLAAVLYVLISGLTKGPGNAPLGSAFAFGPASNVSVASGTAPTGCTAAKECYSLEVSSATSGLNPASMTFSARTATGGTLSISGWTITLVSAAGTSQVTWSGAGTCVSGTGSCSTAMSAGETLVFSTGAALASLNGDTLVAVGTGSFSGEVTSAALPA
jgi:archaeal type IV pilus assembly protein PilA